MRTSFSSLNIRNRPSLLLLLLPYLVLSVLASGHIHGFSAASAEHSVVAQLDGSHGEQHLAEHVAADAAHSCSVCSWLSLHAATLPTSSSVVSTLSATTSTYAFAPFVSTGVPLLCRTRGPPAS